MINMLSYKNDNDPCEYGINILPTGIGFLELAGDVSGSNITKLSYDTMYFLPNNSVYTTKSFRAALTARHFKDFVNFYTEGNRMIFDMPLNAGFYELSHGGGISVLQVGTTEEIIAANNSVVVESAPVFEVVSDLREDVEVQYNSNVFNSSLVADEAVELIQNVTVINMTNKKNHIFFVSLENEDEWFTLEFNNNLTEMNNHLSLSIHESVEISKGSMNITIKIHKPTFTSDNPVLLPIYGFNNLMVRI